jgi:hypothetical protein
MVSHKPEGWGWSCFRCGEKDWVPRPAESLTEKLARLRRAQEVESYARVSVTPPEGYTDPQTWPLEARVWLYQAGISNVEIQALRFVWSPRLQRVVLPVFNEIGEPVFWQARTLDKSNPCKYLSPSIDKRRLIAKYGDGPALVLTEDLLSAYRVSRAGYAGWSLLGTKLNDWTAAEIIKTGKPVLTWLDPDKAGQDNATKINRTLRAYGRDVTNIVSDKDPKLLSKEAIQCLLTTRTTDATPRGTGIYGA